MIAIQFLKELFELANVYPWHTFLGGLWVGYILSNFRLVQITTKKSGD